MDKSVLPFGSWPSSITVEMVAMGSVSISSPRISDKNIYWIESRATEKGRLVIMHCDESNVIQEINPAPFNARTKVHEYGGGAYVVNEASIYFNHFTDNQIYQAQPHQLAIPITRGHNTRFADFIIDTQRNQLISISEAHSLTDHNVTNRLIAISLDGTGKETILAEGYDFYSSPRVSPDGEQLAWLCWNHPNMPWDGTELWTARFDDDGLLINSQKVAGGADESIFQPEWSPDGKLHFVSDLTGWWNIYQLSERGILPLCRTDAEFGRPQWLFGMSTFGFVNENEIICTYNREGLYHLASLGVNSGTLIPTTTPYTDIQDLQVGKDFIIFVGGATTIPHELVKLDLSTHKLEIIAKSVNQLPDVNSLSTPNIIDYPTSGGRTSHAFFYPPVNPQYKGPKDSKPPLIVMSHGGPTSATTSTLKMSTQYWTSRGFAVLDVNYGGSTGYGRAYRQSLNGQWGIVDVDDCENGALYLVSQGLVDKDKLIIRGGSAGGYTTLCALTFRNTFKAGASLYGVSDLIALSADTHKFESKYDQRLVGDRDQYHARSPINFAEKINCPVIFFQGLEDKVVPPSQSEKMVNALEVNHIPVAYIAYEEEGHGFRKAENIKRTMEAELYFYSRVFDFDLPETISPIEIKNL